MLEKIREGATGITAKIILGIIILSFIFAGVGGYINSSADSAAATVNGEEISASTFEKAYQSERGRMEAQLGDTFTQLTANSEYLKSFREGVLQRLINDKLMDQKVRELGIRISDAELRETIVSMPEFAVGGEFNNDRYQALLIQAGYTPADFRDYLRGQMARQQLGIALGQSDFALGSEAEMFLKIQNETRDTRFFEVDATLFESEVTVTDQDINDHYQANIAQYDTEEKVDLAYVEVQVSDFLAEAVVDDADVALYYEENLNNYKTEEERRASHILVEFGEDEQASEERANALLTRLNDGEDFAELAKAESDDSFSGENGGDLDWISRGDTDEAFETAVFELAAEGDITGVVRSEFGFHIIKLTGLKAESVEELENVRAEIEAQLKQEAALGQYLAVQQTMSQLAFEMPDSLEEVAAAGNVEVKRLTGVTRDQAPVPFDNALLQSKAFSDEMLEDRLNSDIIELNDEHFVVFRVTGHETERTLPLAEVRDDIVATLTAQKAQELAMQWADSVIESLSSEQDVDALLAEKSVSWSEEQAVERYSGSLNSSLSSELFKLGEIGAARAVELNNGNVGVVQLRAINQPEALDSAELQAIQQRLSSDYGQSGFTALMDALNANAEVKTVTQ
ncbi:SurA N-terminal domain-containing protein [Planctobacterium marinum]|uniref:SurA N-terminal domain-containing protein n=1 Tax=Planctobacterium marinum TaxID=1631968 RepID=UPI001E38B679|nr:SurA N-terminal domain-containing protein [Planctobacterium marinum]MCC2605501.1 SurA N-terminal domain-containing protein [Planctobacterium marinum]